MFLNFSENGINIVFEVTEDKKLLLSSFSNTEKQFDEEYKTSNVCSAVAVKDVCIMKKKMNHVSVRKLLKYARMKSI